MRRAIPLIGTTRCAHPEVARDGWTVAEWQEGRLVRVDASSCAYARRDRRRPPDRITLKPWRIEWDGCPLERECCGVEGRYWEARR
jgi:hypothetical protein